MRGLNLVDNRFWSSDVHPKEKSPRCWWATWGSSQFSLAMQRAFVTSYVVRLPTFSALRNHFRIHRPPSDGFGSTSPCPMMPSKYYTAVAGSQMMITVERSSASKIGVVFRKQTNHDEIQRFDRCLWAPCSDKCRALALWMRTTYRPATRSAGQPRLQSIASSASNHRRSKTGTGLLKRSLVSNEI